MRPVTRLFPALVLFAGFLAPTAALGAERLLAVLEGTDTAGKPVRLEIRETPELQVPKEVKASARWQVLPGETVRTPTRPSPRVVELYAGQMQPPELVARLLVSYFGDAGRWTPFYRISEEPAVVRQGGRWTPVTIGQGMPGLIVQHGGMLPNADGFFARIEFSLTTGSLAPGAWLVR